MKKIYKPQKGQHDVWVTKWMGGYHNSSFKSFYLNVDAKSYPSGKLKDNHPYTLMRNYCKRKYAFLKIIYYKKQNSVYIY